ncbi:MAG: hypothetical protein GX871_03270 [Microbacteriaceae bacterium]|nr:hypothetical protein [Microthrixaceae bacterium]NLA09214.1 hypothetical protein [Microbacteriaceae bacterium]HOA86331.1 hypothetical protein [Microbacteriaceae bacterium]HPZ34623.1 hypothetical protein [Microbacteriaceae bacterium]HQC93550.1 hypothetical protein [Microbacteriaceae bacterium]
MSFATILLAQAEEHHGNVYVETLPYLLLAVALFLVLGFLTFSYRDVANRHAAKAEAYARTHGAAIAQGQGHGH